MMRTVLATGILALAMTAMPASAQTLRVKVFPGSQVLPQWTGLEQGIFERHGVKLDLMFTQSSQELRDGLAAGAFEVAHAAADNAVAMVERAKADVVMVVGGDSSMNELYAQSDVRSVADLKGRTVIVDAPNTAFALQVKKILKMSGLKAGEDYQVHAVGGTFLRVQEMLKNRDYAASTLNPPFSMTARAAGLRSLGWVVELIGPYQGFSGFTLRPWAAANGDLLERYIAAYVESMRFAVAPQNRAASVRLLGEKLKLAPEIAERTFEAMTDPKLGLARDARFDVEGFRNVLALRAEIEGDWGGTPPAAERYYDLSYYERALKRIRN